MASYDATVLTKTPLFYYKFQEAALATTAVDSSGHGYDATVAGGSVMPTWQAAGPTINGTAMKSGDFDGATHAVFSNDAAVIAAFNAVRATTWSFSCWVYNGFTGSGWDSLLGTSFNGLWLAINGTTADADDNVGAAKQGVAFAVTSRPGIPANTWKHICITRNSATWACYVNGVDVSFAGTDQAVALAASGLIIGSGYDGTHDYYLGRLAYAAFFETTLSAGDVLAQYNASQSIPDAPVGGNSAQMAQILATLKRRR